jgi:anti-anti-sigma factor
MDQVFDLDWSQVDGHAEVRFVGELDIATVAQAHAEAIEVLDRTVGALTLDLSDLIFCDASGISLLLQLDSETRARGRLMVLRHPTPFVDRVFKVAGVSESLTIEEGRCG